jgi:very-short-patch-repair endonuclease
MSASRQSFLTRARARAIGLPLTDLRGPRYTRLYHDTYVPSAEVGTLRVQAATAMSRLPQAHHVSHHTAVRLWGGVAPDSADVHVSMATRQERCRRSGVAAHLAGAGVRVTTRHGLAISTPVQAFLDLASVGVNLVDLVIAGDSLVKATKLSPAALVEAADEWHGRHAKKARRAARLVRAGVDSPMETRLRLLLVLAGLPEPDVNFILRTPDGSWRRRFDLCYPGARLIIEYDGRQHAFDREQWSNDIARREELDGLRWRLVVIESDGIHVDPLRTLQRVRDALAERGVRVPRVSKAEWTRHFVAYR